MKRSEIYLQLTTNPSDTYATDAWMQFVSDFTGDGWADAVNCSFSGGVGCTLYVNPKGEPRRWDKHLVVPALPDRNRRCCATWTVTGRPEIVYGAEGQLRYAKPDPANPTGTWVVRNVSEPRLHDGPWARRRRHERRRTDRHPQPIRMVGTAARGQRRAVDVPSAGIRLVQARDRRWKRHGRLRRERRQAERCRHGAGRARLGAGVVRAEARRAGRHLVRAAHDHGRPVGRRTPAVSRSRSRTARASPTSMATASRTSSSASATGRTATPTPIPIRTARPCCTDLQNGSKSEGARRRGVRSRAGSQPFRHRLRCAAGRSEPGRADGHRDGDAVRNVHLLGAAARK